MSNFGLGKGLKSLIPNKKEGAEKNDELNGFSRVNGFQDFIKVPLEKIRANPFQPRKCFEEGEMGELVESIRTHGIIQPLIVAEFGDQFELIAGERRLRAAAKLGYSEVPAIIRRVEDKQKLELALIENIQRENLNPLEEALAYQRLMNDFSMTQEQVASQVSKSRAQIANTLRLLSLPVEIKSAIEKKIITFGHAKVILALDTSEKQLKLFNDILNRGLSVREVEGSVAKIKPGYGRRREATPDVILKEKELERYFGTKVRIRKNMNKGVLEISFYSAEELEDIFSKIKNETTS